MMSGSGGSILRASAGSPSVTKSIQRICNGSNASGIPSSGVTSMTQILPEFVAPDDGLRIERTRGVVFFR